MDNYMSFLAPGLHLNKVEARQRNGMWAIFATEDIKMGEVIIKLAHQYALSAFKVYSDPDCRRILEANPAIYPSLKQIGNFKSDFQVLILYLTLKRRGEMKPVFDITPNPSCLLDCNLPIPFPYLDEMKREFQQEYDKHKGVLLDIGLNGDDYDWAYRYCMNRRLSVSNDYPYSFLVPMVDLINHGKNQAIFGLENGKQSEDFHHENNFRIYQYVMTRKYWLLQEDQETLASLAVNETQRCAKALKSLLRKLFRELLIAQSEDVWEYKLFQPNDSEDEDDEEDPRKKSISQPSQQQVQAQVNDDYIRDFYDQQLEESEHDWFTEDQEQPAHLLARAVEDIEKGEEVLNLYGTCGNEHLLMYYGFAMVKNPYDRVRFRFFMDCNTKKEFEESVERCVRPSYVSMEELLKKEAKGIALDQLTSEFKLRKSRISMELLRFLRYYTSLLDGPAYEEANYLQFYWRIIQELQKIYSEPIAGQKGEYWQIQLENYRNSKLRILRNQAEMVSHARRPLKEMSAKIFGQLLEYLRH